MTPRLYILFLAIVVLTSAPTPGFARPPLTAKEQAVTGTWIWKEFDFYRHIKVRNPDRTFVEYRFQVTDYAKPAVTLTLRGTWKFADKRYCETYTFVSFDKWKKLVGHTERQRFAAQTADTFLYVSRDSAPIYEQRLSPAEVQQVRRDPFSYLTIDLHAKYTIEAH